VKKNTRLLFFKYLKRQVNGLVLRTPFLNFGYTLAFIFLAAGSLSAQIEKSHNIDKTFDVGKDGRVNIDHRYGLLKVVKSKDDKVHLNVRFRVEGGDEKQIQKALDQFDLDITDMGNHVNIETDLGIKNWNSRNGKITLSFKNGMKIKGLKKLKAEMLVAVPDIGKLGLKNKYEDIIIDFDYAGDLDVYLYDGDLFTKGIGGDLELEIKYGKANLEDLNDADLTLYDSKMEIASAKNVKLSSKYSEYSIGDTEKLTIQAYDDKMELGNVKGRLDIKDKYSDIKMANFKEAYLDIYDADLVGKKGESLIIDGSKYSKYRFVELDKVEVDNSYDDEFIIRKVGGVKIRESKYTEYDLESLEGNVDLLASYDDKVTVDRVENSFKGLNVNGKYTKINMDIPTAVKYELDIEMKDGNIQYPENDFENQYYKEKSSTLVVRGVRKGAGSNPPKVVVKGYDCKINLE
jgi:hypothetical protein